VAQRLRRNDHSKKSRFGPREIAAFERRLIRVIFESFVADGLVNPEGKTDKQLLRELAKVSRNLVSQDTIPEIPILKPTILQEARVYARAEHPEIAVLLYATWFEHWINGLMSHRGRHVPLTQAESDCLLFSNLEAKYLSFPAIFGFPRIAQKHLRAILDVAAARNQFVHYKYRSHDINKDSPLKVRCTQAIKGAESVVRYLFRYERKYVYKRAKVRIRRLVGKRKIAP